MLETLLLPSDTKERCGLVLTDGSIIEVANLAAEPETSYEMDPVAVLPYLPLLAATWHTHPAGPSALSGEDHTGFLRWPTLEHIIISPDGIKRYKIENEVVIECD